MAARRPKRPGPPAACVAGCASLWRRRFHRFGEKRTPNRVSPKSPLSNPIPLHHPATAPICQATRRGRSKFVITGFPQAGAREGGGNRSFTYKFISPRCELRVQLRIIKLKEFMVFRTNLDIKCCRVCPENGQKRGNGRIALDKNVTNRAYLTHYCLQ